MELMQASNNWATRPADERFVSLYDMQDKMRALRDRSRERDTVLRNVLVAPTEGNGLVVTSRGSDKTAKLSNYAFGQLATLAGAPAGYLRKLPAAMAADCINYGAQFGDEAGKDVRALFTADDAGVHTRAFNGSRYGRIWNSEVVDALVDKFGDGVSGDWKVPGTWGKALDRVTQDNTTLFASDRDMFVFLCDEDHKIEVKNRRNGEPGLMSRGFFAWNSEVGDKTFGLATFFFDYMCANRIVWGATQYKEIKIRHTSGAPDRWAGEMVPMLKAYANANTHVEEERIRLAQARRVDDVDKFLAQRFGPRMTDKIKSVHMIEEHRPIETLWDVTTAVTAYARNIEHTDARVDLERKGGDILELAA
jgi:hypothetical protein